MHQTVFDRRQCRDFELATRREWLLTNHLGGYAMGTIAGMATRRYHGHLVAAVNPPCERMLLLAGIEASIQSDGPVYDLGTNQYPTAVYPTGYLYMTRCTVGSESVDWIYEPGNLAIQKRLSLVTGENTAQIEYRNVGNRPLLLILKPLVAHSPHHEMFHEQVGYPKRLEYEPEATLIDHGGVPLRLIHKGALRAPFQGWYYRFEHLLDMERGLDHQSDLFCPAELRWELGPGDSAFLVATTDPNRTEQEAFAEEPSSNCSHLDLATRPFLTKTKLGTGLIAGFPWFTEWGRDTMISLPGILLASDRIADAMDLLRSYGRFLDGGLIPNRLTEEGGTETNTVDATLWFVRAIALTLDKSWDDQFASEALDWIESIYQHHVAGTAHGIRMDSDGLITQGEAGLQLTWMDAKVNGWVVTPRHGKPVEIQGLWIQLLADAASIAHKLGRPSQSYIDARDRANDAFEQKFWFESGGFLFDTVDPDDASMRPNQVIALAMPAVRFDPIKAQRAIRSVERDLATPVGLRTLAPSDPKYRGRFEGPLPQLDTAYHQGTVWPWLLGCYVDAWIRWTGDRKGARRLFRSMKAMLAEYGVGGIAEVYDGDAPHRPGGCPFQAWSIAEVRRAWQKLFDEEPNTTP